MGSFSFSPFRFAATLCAVLDLNSSSRQRLVVRKPVYVLVLGVSIRIIIYAEETEGIDYTGQPRKCHMEEMHKRFPSDSHIGFSATNLTIRVGQLVSQERDKCLFVYLSDAS
jgi:hypothetical protein